MPRMIRGDAGSGPGTHEGCPYKGDCAILPGRSHSRSRCTFNENHCGLFVRMPLAGARTNARSTARPFPTSPPYPRIASIPVGAPLVGARTNARWIADHTRPMRRHPCIPGGYKGRPYGSGSNSQRQVVAYRITVGAPLVGARTNAGSTSRSIPDPRAPPAHPGRPQGPPPRV